MTVSEWILSGGHAAFVAASYAVGLGLLAVEVALLRRRHARALDAARRLAPEDDE